MSDPPYYGYSFMNKDWDKVCVSSDIWRECLRVLKPGAFAFIMSAPRQDVLSRMICNLQDAGFETGFTSLYWTYAAGFPKAANVSKLVDKRFGAERQIVGINKEFKGKYAADVKRGIDHLNVRNQTLAPEFYKTRAAAGFSHPETVGDITAPATEAAKSLDGSYAGFQPKPALEICLVCMKPRTEKSYVDQALANKKGITWLDDCRIPYKSEDDFQENWREDKSSHCGFFGMADHSGAQTNPKGRFPANLLVSDDVLNDGARHSSGKMNAGIRRSNLQGYTSDMPKYTLHETIGDSGSYSRYFDLDKWFDTTFPFLICAKASKSERNMGLITSYMNVPPTHKYGFKYSDNKHGPRVFQPTNLRKPFQERNVNDGRKTPIDNPFQRGETLRVNIHPTVKPLKLMAYLIMLGSRENDLVLDPFCGSGTTLIAAKMLNRRGIGIEINQEYCEIAHARSIAQLNKVVI